MLTIFTFGLVPGYLPGAYDFEYELETDAGPEKFIHRLPVYERFSVWERLLHQDTDSVLSRALKISEREKRQPKPSLQRPTSGTPAGGAPVAPTFARASSSVSL